MTPAVREPASTRGRLHSLLLRILPFLFCLALYWLGLRAWFQRDDFAWLALHLQVHDLQGFFAAMFRPLAQGTIRPWSERLPFLLGWWLFGMEAPAWRALAFATMFANLALLTAVVRRLTGSGVAALAAPILWLASPNLYFPMTWSSSYNQILCAFFLLSALECWVRYTETGQGQYLGAQWALFLLGFGALEIQVVYPALAALYALCRAPGYVRRTLPMFAVSAAYAVLHRSLAPDQVSGTYRMHFDASILDTLGRYLVLSFAADRYAVYRQMPVWPVYAIGALAGVALLAFAISRVRSRDRLPWFFAGWFFIALAPVLPLRDHVSDYYLTVPLIGLAMLGAYAVGTTRGLARVVAVGIALLWAVPSAWMAQGMTRWYYDMSRRNAKLVRSVATAARNHPGKGLLIEGIDTDLFWQCWADRPLLPLGIRDVWLAPGSETRILPLRPDVPVAGFVLPEPAALDALRNDRLVVYELLPSGGLRNITPIYHAQLEHRPPVLPSYVDLQSRASQALLGPGWWQAEEGHRWMSKRASFHLRPAGTQLILRGVAPEPRGLAVHIGNTTTRHSVTSGRFEVTVAVPAAVRQDATAAVSLEVDRVSVSRADGRELGLAFASAQVVR